jgi:hypothetical protein
VTTLAAPSSCHRPGRRRAFFPVLPACLLVLLAAGGAWASDEAAASDEEPAVATDEAPGAAYADRHGGASRAQKIETENAISGRLLGGVLNVDGRTFQMWGAGLAFERIIGDGILAVEFAVEVLTSADATAFPIELVIEKPIELNESVELYFGAGPILVPHIVDGRFEMGAGAITVFGAEWEILGPLATFLELDTAVVFLDGRPILEADLGTGLIYRF